MRKRLSLLPNRIEIAIFATLAVILAGVVQTGAATDGHDLMLAMLAMPLFVTAAVMGLRRSPQWADPEVGDAASEGEEA